MLFSNFALFLENLEKTPSRLQITEILSQLLTKADQDEVDKLVYLTLGNLGPSFEGKVFNLAEKMMVKSIARAAKKPESQVMEEFKKQGDLGITAEKLTSGKDKHLTVIDIFLAFVKIADQEGEDSVERKIDGMANLFLSADSLSVRYLARIPVGKLRLGFSDKTVLDALSWMETGSKALKKNLDEAYQVLPDIGKLALKVKKMGIKKACAEISPQFGIPVLSMLGNRLKDSQEIITKMGKVGIEPKFDGIRAQIHFKKGNLPKIFTRNLNDVSWMFPEIKEMDKFIVGDEYILDSEAVGVDEKTRKMVDFASTMTRRRKYDIGVHADKTPIKFYIFDVLAKNGHSLMKTSYLERKKTLKAMIKPNKTFEYVEHEITLDPDRITVRNKEDRVKGYEGIFIKKIDSGYVPGRLGYRWVKLKERAEEKGKMIDTIDCVVMGFTRGKGKRSSFGVGQFLAGIRDGENIKTITKVGTGLTDEQFKELNQRLKQIVVEEKPDKYEVIKEHTPDFWVRPEVVVELVGDVVSKSPKHTSGYAIRFPRLVRFRNDKNINSITTLKEIANY